MYFTTVESMWNPCVVHGKLIDWCTLNLTTELKPVEYSCTSYINVYFFCFLLQYLCNFHKTCSDPIQCIALVCYGKFLHTLIAGWDEKECCKVYETIGENTNMIKNLNSLVKLKPGKILGPT